MRLCRFRTPQQRKSHVTQGDILLEIPCADIDHVMLFGNVQVTTQALHELLEHGIELAIFSFSGRLIGQLTPPKTKNILLRMAQYERHQDADFCLEFGREIVTKKINDMLKNLRSHRKRFPDSFRLQQVKTIEQFLMKVNNAKAVEELLGYEGAASAAYFGLFGNMVLSPWKFVTRTRRPPKDPVNAVLSFGYVVLGSEIQSLLDGIGYDPYLGFYHVIHYGRPSLALDLLEEFRHSVIDRIALHLFNLGMMKEEDFYQPKSGGIYLASEGKKKFFKAYERMAGSISEEWQGSENAEGFRKRIKERIYALANKITSNSPNSTQTKFGAEDFEK